MVSEMVAHRDAVVYDKPPLWLIWSQTPGGEPCVHATLNPDVVDDVQYSLTPCEVQPFDPNARPLSALQSDIGAWAVATFGPGDRFEPCIAHMRRELAELERETDPAKQPEEAADVLILLCNLAHRMGWDLTAAVDAKMAKNRARKWKQPDAEGVIEHDPDASP